MATLGISTNTRLLGLAIINSENSLVDYSIHLFKSSWSPSKANMIVTSLEPCVRQYCIKRVVLSIPHVYHQTREFKLLISCFQKFFEAHKIPVYSKTPHMLDTLYPPEQKETKKTLMQALTLMYPQLTLCYHKEMRNKKRYYIKLFEAVAVAALHERQG